MNRRIIAEGVYAPANLFAHAVELREARTVYSSGFLARDPLTGIVGPVGDVAAQTSHCLSSIEKVLATAGARLEDIVKMTVFLRDARDYDAMNAIRRQRLAGCTYASSTVIAGLVDANALVEIEVVASLSEPAGEKTGDDQQSCAR
jgi:2-iminobutanoate/2-iminopropanoate deaminase